MFQSPAAFCNIRDQFAPFRIIRGVTCPTCLVLLLLIPGTLNCINSSGATF